MSSRYSPSVRRLPAMTHNILSYSQALAGRQKAPLPAVSARSQARSTSSSGSIRADTNPEPQRWERKADHQPRTSRQETAVYVLTLSTTPSLSEPLTALRDKHFPIHLNHTLAHLTLFHALPGSEMDGIIATLNEHCRNTRPFKVTTGAPFRLKRGVGINVAQGAEDAQRVRRELQRHWANMLSAQDSGGWRAHWTIQNKVDEEVVAVKTMSEIQHGFEGADGEARGCTLWRYERGGRWKFERQFDFDGGE